MGCAYSKEPARGHEVAFKGARCDVHSTKPGETLLSRKLSAISQDSQKGPAKTAGSYAPEGGQVTPLEADKIARPAACNCSRPETASESNTGGTAEDLHFGRDDDSGARSPSAAPPTRLQSDVANGSCCARHGLSKGGCVPECQLGSNGQPAASNGPLAQACEEQFTAPMPANEEGRMQALCSLGVLDTVDKSEDHFDDITKLLCQVFHVPVAIVTLIGSERQWFKSVQGFPVRMTDRRTSICAWTLLPQHPTVLVVPDVLEDARFVENPFVRNEPFIRFYAGAPLVTSTGHRLGSLCILDRKPRELEAESCNMLINFAEIVVRELERDRMRVIEAERIRDTTSGLLRAFDAYKEGIMVCSSSTAELEVLYFNDAWARMTGIERSAIGSSVWDIFQLREKKDTLLTMSRHAIDVQRPFAVDLSRDVGDGEVMPFKASFRPASKERLDEHTPPVAIPGLMGCLKDDGVAEDLYFCTMVEAQRAPADGVGPGCRAAFRDEPSTAPEHPFEDVQLGPLLGQGSFGRVYRGIWNGKHVAVKIIQPFVQTQAPASGSLSRQDKGIATDPAASECQLTSQLEHPNIVATYKTARVPFVAEGSSRVLFDTWMLLEYCDQGTLQYAIERGKFDEGFVVAGKRNQQPELDAIRRTAREIAAAVAYLHGRGILHGDLCGGNVLLIAASSDTRGFVAKVADFGLARNLEAGEIMTQTHGTVTHMPPELLTAGHLSKAADSYAFGTMLWELFSGRRPWAGLQPMQVIYHVTIMRKSLRFPESTPPGFRGLGEACLHPDPARRPTFDEILRRLDGL